MNVIFKIEGREAIPVRAIPLLTNWEAMSPDVLSNVLATGEDALRYQGLQAYFIEDGVVRAMQPTWWKNFACCQLAALDERISHTQINQTTGLEQWRAESLGLLPAGVFVWKDVYEALHALDWDDRFRTFAGWNLDEREVRTIEEAQELIKQKAFRRERIDSLNQWRELCFTPYMSSEKRALVLEGFELYVAKENSGVTLEQLAASAKPKQRGAAQDAAILAAIRNAGHDPLALQVSKAGLPGIKAATRKGLEGNSPLFQKKSTVFDKAWERLRLHGDIADKA